MIVVSDTSPILNLILVGRLDLLARLHREVLIPPAVHEELVRSTRGTGLQQALDRWLFAAAAEDRERVSELSGQLDPGEAEAIVLALERNADLLLIDERRGRRVATSLGVRVTGLLGILVEGKRKGLLGQVKPVLDELRGLLDRCRAVRRDSRRGRGGIEGRGDLLVSAGKPDGP